MLQRGTEDNRGNRDVSHLSIDSNISTLSDVSVFSALSSLSVTSPEIEAAIASCVPEVAWEKRHKLVFQLARSLKAVAGLSGAPVDQMKDYVNEWHRRSSEFLGGSDVNETWIDFMKAWPKVKYARGSEPMVEIFERSQVEALPAAAREYESVGVKQLLALCRELQRSTGDGPFFISNRAAARLLDVTPMAINRWFFLLVHDGHLEVVVKGGPQSRQATRYRYLAW